MTVTACFCLNVRSPKESRSKTYAHFDTESTLLQRGGGKIETGKSTRRAQRVVQHGFLFRCIKAKYFQRGTCPQMRPRTYEFTCSCRQHVYVCRHTYMHACMHACMHLFICSFIHSFIPDASRRQPPIPQDFGCISFVCGLSREMCQKVDVVWFEKLQSLW